MGKNEIRIRRQLISSGRIAHHRNYGDVMQRHERELKIKRITRVFIYFLLIAFLVILVFLMNKLEEKNKSVPQPENPATAIVSSVW